jgi:DNA-binding transcriptional ArsR family regulator
MVVDHVSPSAGRAATGQRADRLFHALSDVTRRDIVARAMQGEHSVSALARHYPMSVTAVQKHVDVLSRAGLISKERRGREQIVRPGIEAIHDARRVLDGLEAMWRRRIERMGDILAQDQEESFT